jgi:AraC-like DNA-binding protein
MMKTIDKPVNETQVERVYRLYFDEGLSMRKVASKLGFRSSKPIQRIFKERGWQSRPSGPRRQDIDLQEVKRLYFDAGLTLKEIAKKVGMDRHTIGTMFREQGWETRRASASKVRIDPDEVHRFYYEKGLTKEETAHRLGVSEWALRKIFREMGWTSRIRSFDTDEERELARREKSRSIYQRIIDLRDGLFGTNCEICGAGKEERNLAIHRKDGSKHPSEELWRLRFLESMTPDDWARLCTACHRGVHWLMIMFKVGWDEIALNVQRPLQLEPDIHKPLKLPPPNAPSSNKYEDLQEKSNLSAQDLRRLLFGETCFLCSVHHGEMRLATHRKDGRRHSAKLLKTKAHLRTLSPDEWVTLCQKCHRYVHWAMDELGLEWKWFESSVVDGPAS